MPTPRRRFVVGAFADDDLARRKARALLLSGHEVVFVGGDQSAEQLARAAQAEDAATVIVDGDDSDARAVRDRLDALGLSHVEVGGCDQPDAPPGAKGG